MATRQETTVRERFSRALDALVEDIRKDRSILAAILCGSLSHDTVWERSDIDLVLVTVDDRLVPEGHARALRRRAERARVAGAAGGVPQDGRGLDSQLVRPCAPRQGPPALHPRRHHRRLVPAAHDVGQRDTEFRLLSAASEVLHAIDKAHKWFVTRGDLEYSALWILYAATGLARIEVIGRRMIADREVLPQAMALNPAFFKTVYTDLLNTPKTRAKVEAALAAIDGYMEEREPCSSRR